MYFCNWNVFIGEVYLYCLARFYFDDRYAQIYDNGYAQIYDDG